jgi:hypothetical protein
LQQRYSCPRLPPQLCLPEYSTTASLACRVVHTSRSIEERKHSHAGPSSRILPSSVGPVPLQRCPLCAMQPPHMRWHKGVSPTRRRLSKLTVMPREYPPVTLLGARRLLGPQAGEEPAPTSLRSPSCGLNGALRVKRDCGATSILHPGVCKYERGPSRSHSSDVHTNTGPRPRWLACGSHLAGVT